MNNDIVQHITLELTKEVGKSTLSVKKNDTNTRRVQATLTNNGGLVELKNVVKAIVKAIKPDGKMIWNDCTKNGDNLFFVMTSQMINVPGDVECELEVTWKDESVLTTPRFTVHVYDSINTGVESQNEYKGIIQALAETINNREESQMAAHGALISENKALESEVKSQQYMEDAKESEEKAKAYEQITKEYRDYAVAYIQNFIKEQEESNPTLAMANAYTDQKTNAINGNIGDLELLDTAIKTCLVDAINTVYRLAIGKNQALAFGSYAEMVQNVLETAENELNVGQNIYIGTIGVPDIWVYEISEEYAEYTYTTDQALIDEMQASGTAAVGYYKLAMLETQKVDLTDINNQIADLRDRFAYPVSTTESEE